MELETRVEKLEKRCRRYEGALILLFFLLFGAFFLAAKEQQSATQAIEAEKFVVKDPEGRERAYLDEGGMVVLDGNGKERIRLGLTEKGATFAFFNENQKPEMTLSSFEGEPSLVLGDDRRTQSVSLYVLEEGTLVGETDARGKVRALLGVNKNKEFLRLFDSAGKLSWSTSGKRN